MNDTSGSTQAPAAPAYRSESRVSFSKGVLAGKKGHEEMQTHPHHIIKYLGLILASLVAGAVVVSVVVSGETENGRRSSSHGIFSGLQIGQDVAVKDLGQRYEVSVFGRSIAPLSHKIIEIGPDYLTVKDIAGVNTMRIPVYSIKSVITVNIEPRRQDRE